MRRWPEAAETALFTVIRTNPTATVAALYDLLPAWMQDHYNLMAVTNKLSREGLGNATARVSWVAEEALRDGPPDAPDAPDAPVAMDDEPSAEETLEEDIQHDQRKAREREQTKLLQSMRQEEARFRILRDAITQSLLAWPAPPPHASRTEPLRSELRLPAFLLSDTHTGLFAGAKEVGERFAYNYKEFQRRWDLYKQGVWETVDEQARLGEIDHIALWDLGDTVHNASMHGESSRRSVDIEATVDQAHIGAELRAELLWQTRARYPHLRVTYDVVSGNHDRISAKYGVDAPYDSWAMVTGMMVHALCRNDDMIQVKWHTHQQIVLSYWDTTVLLTHGHGIKGSALLPWYGIDRRAMRWVTFHQLFFDAVCIGHYHNPADWESNSLRIIVNGAFPDSDGYAASLSLSSAASQRALILTPDKGISYVKDIPVSGRRRIPPTVPDHRTA